MRSESSKITVTKVKDYLEHYYVVDYEVVDNADVLKQILSRQLPRESFNGILSLALAFRFGATDEEIEKALVSINDLFYFILHLSIYSTNLQGILAWL